MTASNLARIGHHGFSFPVSTVAAQNHVIDLSSEGVAWCFQAEYAEAITHVSFRYGARTGTPPTYSVTLEGLATADDAPDGTDVGGGSATLTTFTPPADATWDATWRTITLTNSYTPSVGQCLAIVIRYSSGTIDASNNSSFCSDLSNAGLGNTPRLPFSSRNTSGSWAAQTKIPVFSYTTSSGVHGYPWLSEWGTRSAATIGHRQALKFTIPTWLCSSCTIRGVRFAGSPAGTTGKAPLVKLWNNGGTALQSTTIDADWFPSVTAVSGVYEVLFADSLSTIVPGDTYYIGMEVAQSTSSGVILAGHQVNAAGDLNAFPFADWILSEYNGSSWSDQTTTRPHVELILDDVTAPSGGGGIIVPAHGYSGIGVF